MSTGALRPRIDKLGTQPTALLTGGHGDYAIAEAPATMTELRNGHHENQ
jgi:hypothetical protein